MRVKPVFPIFHPGFGRPFGQPDNQQKQEKKMPPGAGFRLMLDEFAANLRKEKEKPQ